MRFTIRLLNRASGTWVRTIPSQSNGSEECIRTLPASDLGDVIESVYQKAIDLGYAGRVTVAVIAREGEHEKVRAFDVDPRYLADAVRETARFGGGLTDVKQRGTF